MLSTITYGDAVSNDTLAIYKLLSDEGYETSIYAENADDKTKQNFPILPAYPLPYLGRRYADILRTERDVVLYDRRDGLVVGILKNDPEIPPYLVEPLIVRHLDAVYRLGFLLVAQWDSVNYDLAPVGRQKAVHQPRQRALAAAVMPAQRDKTAFLYFKADVFHRFDRYFSAVGITDVFKSDDRRHGFSSYKAQGTIKV